MSSRRYRSDPAVRIAALEDSYTPQDAAASPDAFAVLYDQYLTPIYRYFHARTGSIHDAQDLTAETFRAAWEGYSHYQSTKGTPVAWLMGIARHKLADHLRHASTDLSLDGISMQASQQLSPERQIGQALQFARVAEALGKINPARAEALVLHLYVGLCLEETGQILQRSPQAVKKLVQRGLADLRQFLPEEEVE